MNLRAAIAAALIAHGNIELVVIGGRIDRTAGAAIGAMAVGAIRDWRFDLCLLGACAIAEEGISALHVEDAAMKRTQRLSRLIVEKGSPAAELKRIRAAGVEIEEVGADD